MEAGGTLKSSKVLPTSENLFFCQNMFCRVQKYVSIVIRDCISISLASQSLWGASFVRISVNQRRLHRGAASIAIAKAALTFPDACSSSFVFLYYLIATFCLVFMLSLRYFPSFFLDLFSFFDLRPCFLGLSHLMCLLVLLLYLKDMRL